MSVCLQQTSGFVRFHRRIWNAIIGTAFFFIPREILTPQCEKLLVNHPVVISPDGSHVSMYLRVSFLLCGVSDMLQAAQFGDPDYAGLEKSPDHDLIVVREQKGRRIFSPVL